MPESDLPSMTVEEIDRELLKMLEEAQARIEAYDERAALSEPEDGLTTDQRAIACLQRPERFPGEHTVAQMWLHESPTARIWRRSVQS